MLLKKGIHFYIVLGLFAVYLINGIIAIPRNSVTYDEMDHWSYGKRVLMRKTDKIYPFDDASTMPVSGINAIPRAAEQVMNPGLLKNDGGFSDIMHGRYVTLIVCLLTGFFIYRLSKELFGENGALLSLFFFVFCPNLNGHGILLTTDAYTALFTVSTAWFYWKYTKHPGWKNFLLFSFSLALAQLVKYTMIHLLFLFAIISLVQAVRKKTLLKEWKQSLLRLLVALIICLVVVNAGFFFNKPFKNLQQLDIYSNTLLQLKDSFIGRIPLPLPTPYVEGLDMTMYMNDLGAGHPNVSDANYLLGESRTGKGFWDYYLIVFIFKTPLTVLLILIGAIIFLFARKKNEGHPSTMSFLLFLIFYFLLVLGLQNNVQIGIRHAIMVYPLLYVLAGFFVTASFYKKWPGIINGLLVLYSLFAFYFFFPNLISYSNELIPDKKKAYKVMADSNLDFGQGRTVIENYFKVHPDTRFADSIPTAGKFAIGINDYLNLKTGKKYEWISGFEPVKHINHCYLLINVTEADLKKGKVEQQ